MKIVETDGQNAAPAGPAGEGLADFVARGEAAQDATTAVIDAAEPVAAQPGEASEMVAIGAGVSTKEAATAIIDAAEPAAAQPGEASEMAAIGAGVATGVGWIVHVPRGPGLQPYPAIITRVHDAACVNLFIIEDGAGTRFMSSQVLGEHWVWPE